jgi:hypothetical protein
MIVTGTVLNPRPTRSWYASRSVSTFFATNGMPARERNSFTCSQGRQLSPAKTMTLGGIVPTL